MKKRILASFLSLVLVLSLVPASALATEEENSGELPVLADESLSLTGYCGADTSYESQTYNCSTEYQNETKTFTGTYYSNAIWTLTENETLSDGSTTAYKLTISGTGAIGDFESSWAFGRPWHYALAEVENCAVTESRNRITEIEIADGITEIGAHTFEAYGNISSIVLPDSVMKVGENAFNYCQKAASLDFGDGLKEIGEKAFSDCKALTSISLPASLETIGSSAFGGCSALTGNLVIPSSVTTIGNSAFSNCTKLTGTLTIGSSVTSIGKSAFGSCKFSGTLTIPDSVTSIGEAAFNACEFTSISLGNGLVEIGKNAFYNSGTYSGHLSIPDSVTTIGESAFSSLEFSSIHLGKSVKTIGASAFINCTSVHSLDIASVPSSITYGTNAFHSMGNPNILYVNGESQKNAIDSYITSGRSITAITNGGTFAPDTEFTSGALATPTKEGSIFAGWYTKDGTNGDWGETVTEVKTGETYYAKWIELNAADITMAYGASQTPPTIEGVSLTGWTSDNEKVVQIVNGELKAVGVGKANITADAAPIAPRSGETLTVSVTVTAKQIKVSMTDKTETYNEQPHTIEAQPAEGGTLPADLELVYSYKEASADDSTYIPVAPTHPGVYTVKVESGNLNYTLTDTAGTTGPITGPITATLTISEPQAEQDVSDKVAVTAPSLVYDGKAKVYTATYEGITDWTIAYYDTEGEKLASAPVNAGDYWVTINGENKDKAVYASITIPFTIDKVTVTIRPNDKSAYVGDAVPVLGENDYTMTGLVGDDTLSIKPTLAYESAPDMSKTGTYAIKASGAVVGPNYEISYEDGTLTVSRRSSGGGSSSSTEYAIAVDDGKNGSVSVSPKRAEKGDTVTITVDPDKGYELDELTVTDSKGRELDLTDKGNGKYTFKMPGTRVEVEVSFKLVETEPEAPVFADVPASAYYADAVEWAVEQGITSGTSATTFSPDMSCTRAQIVTFLWRANGSPKADGANPFTDVSADAYYYDAVLWAVKEGITSGTSATTFSPDATVTRGQTVTFLYRGAGTPAVSGGSFADVAADAYYADAVVWAVKEGITSGTGGNSFSPDAPCTRGQIVTFLYRDAK